MSTQGTYELTHPESMTESELKEILENRCIDFSNYKNLSKSELIELYKRVAMPLPQRQSENAEDSDKKHRETDPNKETHRNSVLLNGTLTTKRSISDTTKILDSSWERAKSPADEPKQTPKLIRLWSTNNITKCNGIDKRSNNEMEDGASSRKRQKITWP